MTLTNRLTQINTGFAAVLCGIKWDSQSHMLMSRGTVPDTFWEMPEAMYFVLTFLGGIKL